MPQPSKPAFDFSLTISGTEYPFLLAIQNGVKQWNDGLAPMLTPQVRTSGFGFDHIPPEIEVLEVTESFGGGAGFDTARKHANRYNYSRYIDASWEDRAFKALEQRATLESDGTAIAATPVKFYQSSYGLYMLAGAYVYKWDLGSASWVEKSNESATYSGAAYKDMVELDSVLYASRGPNVPYNYSIVDGNTFTAFTDADEPADVFTQRGNSSDVAAIWKVLTNVVKTTTRGINGGVAWTGSDEVGNTGETVQSALTVDNTIYVFKKEGIYSYDGVNTQDVWKTQYIVDGNGKNAYLHSNGKMYAPYGRNLKEYDPYGDTALRTVYPTEGMDSKELLGDITAIGGDDTPRLYHAVKNRDGNTYIMKGREDGGKWVWHSIAYLGANDCNTLLLVGPGVMHATNPALVFGYGTSARYLLLPRENQMPTDDTVCTFDITEGVLYDSYRDFGALCYHYFLNRGALLGSNITASRYATLKYEVDRSGTETTLVSATSEDMTDANESAEVDLHVIRPILYLGTGDKSASPVVDAYMLGATLNPLRSRMWRPIIRLNEHDAYREGVDTDNSPSIDTIRRVLFGAVTKRITLTDRANLDYTVRLLDIQPGGVQDAQQGGEERDSLLYQLTLVEVRALTSDATTGIYDESAYDGTHVYA